MKGNTEELIDWVGRLASFQVLRLASVQVSRFSKKVLKWGRDQDANSKKTS